jgi:hypothetical protein
MHPSGPTAHPSVALTISNAATLAPFGIGTLLKLHPSVCALPKRAVPANTKPPTMTVNKSVLESQFLFTAHHLTGIGHVLVKKGFCQGFLTKQNRNARFLSQDFLTNKS